MDSSTLEMLAIDYGHGYLPEYTDQDVMLCAKEWSETETGQDYLELYYPDSDSVSYMKIAEDFEDLITDWLEPQIEAWKNAE